MPLARPFAKARSVNATTTSFASKIPTTTEPSGDAGSASGATITELGRGGNGYVPAKMMAVFYGTGNDNDTFDVRLYGWRRIGSGTTAGTLWVPVLLGQFTCTLSAVVGIAGAPVVATERFVDTIIIHATVAAQGKTTDTTAVAASNDAGSTTGTIIINSNAADLIAHMLVPLEGFEKIEFDFDRTGATACNALITFLDD